MELKFKAPEGLLIISAVRKNEPSAHILFRQNRADFLLCFSSGYAWDFFADFCSFRRGNIESCIKLNCWSIKSSVFYIVRHFGGCKQTPFPAQLNLKPFEGRVVPLSYNLSPNTGQKNKWAPGLLLACVSYFSRKILKQEISVGKKSIVAIKLWTPRWLR